MTQMLHKKTANETASGTPKTQKGKNKQLTPIVLQTLAMIAIAALLYPTAADWVSRIGHNAEVSGYANTVSQLPENIKQNKLQAAYEYNQNLPATVLHDPYGTANTEAELEENAAYKAYKEVLKVSDNGVIGELNYANLNINLPIYHGTGDKAISTGVGHLYGSSLPVGGPSTHSVLTSHSGLVNASLFTSLPKAEIGDTFKITVLGETHYYQVDGIETIEPFVTDSLGVKQNEDRVTLITCTPIGVNSHRLLVHSIRIPTPEITDTAQTLTGDGRQLGFPWWIIIFLGGSTAVWMLLFTKPKTKQTAGKHGKQMPSTGEES